MDFLQRHPDEACFVTLWPDDVHTPFRPSAAMIAKYGGDTTTDNLRENFYGVLEEYDRQIGRLLDGLAAQGKENNTILFFTGDNGPAPDYNRDRTNGMNGNKLSLYEGGIRQPFIIKWPGHIPAGGTNSQTVLHAVDMLPTLCGLAGIPVEPEGAASTDGENLSAAMLGTPVTRTNPLMWEYGRTSQVPRPGAADIDRSPQLAIREGDFMLLLNPNNTEIELYNVRTDPGQYTNLAVANPALVTSMSNKVKAWYATLPNRQHSYPAFANVDFSQFVVNEFVTAEELRLAAGAPSTARIDGVTVAPNGLDDIFAIQTAGTGKSTLLRIDGEDRSISKITDSSYIASELGTPAAQLPLTAGFEYSPYGDRLFLAENGTAGQVGFISTSVGTSSSTLIARSSNYDGLSDHSVIPNGNAVAVRGASGNRTVGTIGHAAGVWTQKLSETQLRTAAPPATQIIPESVVANSAGDEVHLFSHNSPELFRITDITPATPAVTRLSIAALAGVDFHDLAADQAGNLYGYDSIGTRIVVVRRSDQAVFSVSLSAIQGAIAGAGPVVPTAWRGIAARMADNNHAELYLASATPVYGIIKVRFGPVPATISDWTLY